MRYPTRFQQRTLWNAATGVSILILGLLAVGIIWLVGKVFGFLQPVLIPIIVAGIIAFVLDPVVRIFEKRGMSRLKSVIVVHVLMLIGLGILLAAIIPGIWRGQKNLRDMLSQPAMVSQTEAPAGDDTAAVQKSKRLSDVLANKLQAWRLEHRDDVIGWSLAEVDEAGKALPIVQDKDRKYVLEDFAKSRAGRAIIASQDVILRKAKEWAITGSSKIFGFLGLAIGMIMVPIYLFFFLKESAEIRDHWHDYVPLRASRFKTEVVETLQEINGYLISFFRGQVIVAAIDGILVGLVLTLFGLPYGLIIGVFMAILGVIPYVGNILCLVPACIIAWLHAQDGGAPWGMGPWAYVICVIAIFIVVQQINSLVTSPKIVGDSVGLHPLTVIFSMLFWTLILGGFVGALLAVPLTAAVKVLFRRFIWAKQMSPQLSGQQTIA